MTAEKITAKSEIGGALAADDQLVIVDVSDTTEAASGTTKRVDASRLARTGAANTFAATQTITPSAGRALVLGTVPGSIATLELDTGNLGNDTQGPLLSIGRNSSAGAAGPAAGSISLAMSVGSRRLWSDAAGNLRIHTASPTGSSGSPTVSDTAGTVVGTQTSWHETKENIEEWDGAEALAAIRAMTLYSYQMIEDGQANSDGTKPTYKGIVITDEDRENNAWFGLGYGDQQIPALNDRNIFGYMLAAIRHGGDIINELQDQVAGLATRVEALEGGE